MDGIRQTLLEEILKCSKPSPEQKSSASKESKKSKEIKPVMKSTDSVIRLKTKILDCVKTDPGIALVDMAKKMHLETSDLRYAMKGLIQEKKIKRVGERHTSQYFPLETSEVDLNKSSDTLSHPLNNEGAVPSEEKAFQQD